MNDFLSFLKGIGIVTLWLAGITIAGYYTVVGLSYLNILWTRVEEGWRKIVLHNGKYNRSLSPGRRWLGFPGVDTLYSRKMRFLEGVIKEDGTVTVKAHKDENVTSFKTTRFPYALPYKDEEDSHGLPLSGVVVVNSRMVDDSKMFFVASDWYATIVFLVLSCLRDIITMVSYEEITGQNPDPKATANAAKKAIAQLLWEKMNAPREGGKLSVIAELLQTYGQEVDSVELASIDPPEGWRATTLAPYKAQKEKEAAIYQAETSAILFDDTNQALNVWLEGQKAAGHTPTQAQIDAKQEELRQRALAKTPGYQQVHIKGLERATTAVVGGGGGGTGVLIGGTGGKDGGKRGKAKSSDDQTIEEKRAWWRNNFGEEPNF